MKNQSLCASPDGGDSSAEDASTSPRLVVARGLFAGPAPRAPDDLYARVLSGRADRERYAVRLEPGTILDTNTYFGRLPVSYFQRWTRVTEVQLEVKFESSARARLALWASDSIGHDRRMVTQDVEGVGTAIMTAPLDQYADGGSMWLQASTIRGEMTITDLEWTVEAPTTVRSTVIGICTFDRPDDCANTIAALAADKTVLSGIDALYVVDQGTQAVETRPLFSEVAAQLADKLVYLRQPNLGGSGGFARAMYEARKAAEPRDVILMDDDILCEPETVLRLCAFASLTSTPSIIGAQMLYLNNPGFLLAGAEHADLATLRVGRWAPNALHSVDVVHERQHRRTEAQYTGWWTCLIPAEVMAAVGLPMPMFIKWDDVEYCLRAAEHGHPTVTLPNAGVWHAEFHWKDYDVWVYYFQIRNGLITAALHGGVNTSVTIKTLAREIVECLAAMRYGQAYTILRAVEDFLDGTAILERGGAAVAARIRDERSRFPETTLHPLQRTAELCAPGVPTSVSLPAKPRKDRMDLLRAQRLVRQWQGKTIRQPVAIATADAYWWHLARFDCAVVSDASQSGVRVLRRDKRTLRELLGRTVRTLRHLRAGAPEAQQRYRDAFADLHGADSWGRLFDT